MTNLRKSPTTDEGIDYVASMPGNTSRKMVIRGEHFHATLNDTTDHDVDFSEDREVQGMWLEVVGAHEHDYVEFFATLPNGTPVQQFGETCYIPPSGIVPPIISERGDVLPIGFKLRVTYHCAKTTGDTPGVYVWYRMRK